MKMIKNLALFCLCFTASHTVLASQEKVIVEAAFDAIYTQQQTSLIPDLYHNDYIEHSPNFSGGTAGIKAYITSLNTGKKNVDVTIARIIAEKDLVAVHSRKKIGKQASIIGVDIFRVENNQIIEHWGLEQLETPKSETVSGHSMIDGGGDAKQPMSSKELTRNKKTIVDFIEKGFAGDLVLMDSLFGDVYIQHNPQVPDGKEVILGYLKKGPWHAKIKHMVLQGDLAFVLVHYPDFNNAAMDIFRLDDQGKIVEHWDVGQRIPEKMPHTNGVF
jgi:predicted SnoaL-like aldol condensation-catalyzing enzyme